NKISLITSLLFFLLGTNVLAESQLAVTSPQNNQVFIQAVQKTPQTSDNKTIVTAAKKTQTQMESALLPTIKAKETEPSFKNYVIPGLVGLIVIFGFGGYWLIFRRKYT
ncbi:MAG: hypothetical protein ACJ8MO_33415, partial [Bacillus sp. (in: firmicutes)]